MRRIIVLGCGTGVGKTWVSVALLRALGKRGMPCLGMKPIESGIEQGSAAEPAPGSDAAALANAGSLCAPGFGRPCYAFAEAVSPHLAARAQGITIDLERAADWVADAEKLVASHVSSDRASWSLVETAGGVFSPLARNATNFDLAWALEPAIWLLVAPDALGVLHDVSATLQAMAARGRVPDHVVLSCARQSDASTGRNAAELSGLGIARTSAVLARDDDRGIETLVDQLLELASAERTARER